MTFVPKIPNLSPFVSSWNWFNFVKCTLFSHGQRYTPFEKLGVAYIRVVLVINRLNIRLQAQRCEGSRDFQRLGTPFDIYICTSSPMRAVLSGPWRKLQTCSDQIQTTAHETFLFLPLSFLKHVYVAHGGLLSPIQTAPTRPPCRANCINCPVLDKGAELQVTRANRGFAGPGRLPGATPHGMMIDRNYTDSQAPELGTSTQFVNPMHLCKFWP